MDFDQILEEIGEFGRYQKTNYFLICLPVMFAAANSLSYVFTAGNINYRCLIPECDVEKTPEYTVDWIQNAVPGNKDTNGRFIPDTCNRYKVKENYNQTLLNYIRIANVDSVNETDLNDNTNKCPAEWFLTSEIERCDQWVFDSTESTILNEWEITCKENAWKLALVGTSHFAGLVIGTAISGFLADRFGRKIIFIVSIAFMSITGVLQGLVWDYISFLVFAFLNAVGTASVYPLAFIIAVEMVGRNKREMSSIVLNYFYAVGEALVGLLAWLCHDWRKLQFVLSAPPLIFVVYYWFVPESVRWLIAKEKHKKAFKIIRKAAHINRKELSESLLRSFDVKGSEIVVSSAEADKINATNPTKKNVIQIDLDGKNKICYDRTSELGDYDIESLDPEKKILNAFLAVLKSKVLLFRFLVLLLIWAVNAFVFYGLSLNSTNLSGNKYLNFCLVCLIEIPGYSMAWIALKKVGRRWSLSGSLFLCSLTCIAGGYVSQDIIWASIFLFLVGKLGITSSFAVIYAYTAEMMPTIIRSGGVGFMSTFARFGAMVAPFVPLLAFYYKPLPLVLFGGVSFIAGCLGLLLPETFRHKLPDTVEEAEQIGVKSR